MKDTDNALESGLAIVANGDTHAAIASGQYVYVKNHSTLAEGMYTASVAIPTNDPLTVSNLTVLNAGGFNAIKAGLDALGIKTGIYPITLASGSTVDTDANIRYYKVGGNCNHLNSFLEI